MVMDHSRVAKDILTYVGGPGNIDAAAHCATRLRLVLNDVRRVDQKALDKDVLASIQNADPVMAKYLSTTFSLSKGDRPHALRF